MEILPGFLLGAETAVGCSGRADVLLLCFIGEEAI